VQCEGRNVRVGARRQIGVRVAENLLRTTLVDAAYYSERLPRFAERMKMDDPTKRVLPLDASAL